MRRWWVLLVAGMTVMAGVLAPTASAVTAPIGRLGDVLRVDYMGIVADVTVTNIDPTDEPPGFGRGPYPPRYQIYRGNITVHVIEAPNPYITSIVFNFRGVTPTGDAYEAHASDGPDDLRSALQNAPPGATVTGGVWWDCYRDLVTNVVLLDKITGTHLAQWNV
ncbi:MAG: hypothetical protein ABW137_18415 [Mycobacterium sp.]